MFKQAQHHDYSAPPCQSHSTRKVGDTTMSGKGNTSRVVETGGAHHAQTYYADAHMDLSLEPRTRLSSPRTIGRKKPPTSKLSTSSGEYACTTRCTKPFHVSLQPGNVLYTDEAVKTYHSPHIRGFSHQTLEIYIVERWSDLQPEGVFRLSAGCPNFVVTQSGLTRLCESGQNTTPDVATRALYAPTLSAKAIRWDSLWSSSVSVIHT
jgi:hypothetical protein